MYNYSYSFIVPVFNRPDEIKALLSSLTRLNTSVLFEVIIVEDGSSIKCKELCLRFRESLNIHYYFKTNTGPGDSRNYGMARSQSDYFIILDSDCIIDENYLHAVHSHLTNNYVDCYGGPDDASKSFSDLQRAINFTMTSFITTGGIRGGKNQIGKFQPRSFNLGISKQAFLATGGFKEIHPGEDPDLVLRLWKLGYKTALIPDAIVYHERRISWSLFYKQVNKFGKVRVILNKWHPGSSRLTYWFPALFCAVIILSIILILSSSLYFIIPLLLYYLMIFLASSIKNNIKIGFMTILAVNIQFIGYGLGFLSAFVTLHLFNEDERKAFPKLFFKS